MDNFKILLTTSLNFASIFFMILNSFYLLLVFIAAFSARKRKHLKRISHRLDKLGYSPSITIIVPCYNESLSIVPSVNSLLSIKHSRFQILIMNDGSKDNTLEILKKEFALKQENLPRWSRIGVGPVKATYRSERFENLLIIDKENSGKAESQNVGIDFCNTDLVCIFDADSILESDALLAISEPFVNDTDMIAVGGTIRILNGSKVKSGTVIERSLPKGYLEKVQIIEYCRSFLYGRIGWNALKSNIIVSGAFGVFKREALIKVGGYTPNSMGEDMELIFKLHHFYRNQKIPYNIFFLPEPVCWTEAPADFKTLRTQRIRWQIGLCQVLWKYRTMTLNPRYGAIGFIPIPYIVLADLMGPFVEIGTLILIALGIYFSLLSAESVWAFFIISYLYGSVITFTALVLDETYSWGEKSSLSGWTLLSLSLSENIGLRQFHQYWRMLGFFQAFKAKHEWGEMKRIGIKESE